MKGNPPDVSGVQLTAGRLECEAFGCTQVARVLIVWDEVGPSRRRLCPDHWGQALAEGEQLPLF